MAKIQVDTMQDNSEIVHYDTPGIPLYIRKGILSDYPGKRAVCHWHDDIELILLLSGKMNYYVNGKIIELKENDGILINTREMHYGYSVNGEDCVFICVLFQPSLLSACKKIYQSYVEPLLGTHSLSYLHLTDINNSDILGEIKKIWQLKEEQNSLYEMNVLGILYSLWSSFSSISSSVLDQVREDLPSDVAALRQMVSYIHSHYREDLSLQTIAMQANICKSKCCKVFKTQVNQSPIDFLNSYRLQVSTDMLTNTTMSISDIALDCGFNHLSYYSKLFLRCYGCTPSEYRKSARTGST